MSDTNCPFCGAEPDIKLQHLGGPDWPPYLCGNSKNSNHASKACLERQAHNKTKAELDVLKLKLQKMNDTPETEDAMFDYDAQAEYWVDSEFAKKLERERNALKLKNLMLYNLVELAIETIYSHNISMAMELKSRLSLLNKEAK